MSDHKRLGHHYTTPDLTARATGNEPPVGAGLGAVLDEVADAVGDDLYRRIPVMPDVALASLDARRRLHDARTAYVSAT